MFKDYDKYLSTSLKVYIFVLVLVLIIKIVGLDYFGLDINNPTIVKLGHIVSYNVPINNIVFLTPLLINQFVLLSITLKDNSKKMIIYNILLLPIFYIMQAYKIKLFGNYSMLLEILYSLIVISIYNKKVTIALIKRFFKVLFMLIAIQTLSVFIRSGYSIEYVTNPVTNILLNLDYIIVLIIIYKINFTKGDDQECYCQVDQCLSLLKKISLKKSLKRLQVNLHKFRALPKQERLSISIYIVLSLLWNTLSLVIILLVANLNHTFIECLFILTSFWLSKHAFGKPFHLPSMIHCFIVSNLTYYILNRITTPLGISIFIPILLGVGLSYVTSKLVKKTYKPLYRGMPKELFNETILKIVDKDSIKYKICYDFYINKKSDLSLSFEYNYSIAGIRKIKDRINDKIKGLN